MPVPTQQELDTLVADLDAFLAEHAAAWERRRDREWRELAVAMWSALALAVAARRMLRGAGWNARDACLAVPHAAVLSSAFVTAAAGRE